MSLTGRCYEDQSSFCIEHDCNACGRYPKRCEDCKRSNYISDTKVKCNVDGSIHNMDDGSNCSSFHSF